jgi:hypothetical protein
VNAYRAAVLTILGGALLVVPVVSPASVDPAALAYTNQLPQSPPARRTPPLKHRAKKCPPKRQNHFFKFWT